MTRVGPAGAPRRTAEGNTAKSCTKDRQNVIARPGTSSGKMMWPEVRGAGTGSASVVAADGRLYFRYQNGMVALVEAALSACTPA